MKNFSTLTIAVLLGSSMLFYSCKSDKSDKNMDDTTELKSQEPTPMPESVSVDDDLNNKVKNIMKDYPDATAAISGGEITLTGTVEEGKLSGLIESLNTLKPKKINNDLTVKQ